MKLAGLERLRSAVSRRISPGLVGKFSKVRWIFGAWESEWRLAAEDVRRRTGENPPPREPISCG